jgi:hypothetical protein
MNDAIETGYVLFEIAFLVTLIVAILIIVWTTRRIR